MFKNFIPASCKFVWRHCCKNHLIYLYHHHYLKKSTLTANNICFFVVVVVKIDICFDDDISRFSFFVTSNEHFSCVHTCVCLVLFWDFEFFFLNHKYSQFKSFELSRFLLFYFFSANLLFFSFFMLTYTILLCLKLK